MTEPLPEAGTSPTSDTGTSQTRTQFVTRPLSAADPVRVGDYWLDAVLHRTRAGAVYQARPAEPSEAARAEASLQALEQAGQDPTPETVGKDGETAATAVALVLLSEGAAGDRVARDRFAGEINPLHIDLVLARGGQGQDAGKLGRRYRASEAPVPSDREEAPWVVLPLGQADRGLHMLQTVELSLDTAPEDAPGPAYALPWAADEEPGRAPMWPLPWPGRHDRAGWVTLFLSWLLMVVLTALAVLLAILLFRNEPPQNPPPPQPQQTSAPADSSASPSPDSASPSPDSASPSPDSASPTPSGSGAPGPRSKL